MAKHSDSSYRATGKLSRFHAECDMCVCVRPIASQRKGIPESTTRVCVVPGPRFAGGGAGNKTPACHLFGPLFSKGGAFAQGGGPEKQTTAELIQAAASGRGGAKTETRATFDRASVTQVGGALNTCKTHEAKGVL